MKSDSVLITGLHSGTINKLENEKTKKEERKRLKESKKQKLKPAAEIIIAEIDREREAVQKSLLATIDAKTPQEDVKSTIVALQLYADSLTKIRVKLTTILRERTTNEKETD